MDAGGERRNYSRHVAENVGQGWPRGDELRRLVAGFSFGVAVFAAVADPSSAADLVLVALPVAAFAAWSLTPRVRLWAVSPAVLVPVVVAQRSGSLEPLFFEVSILAFVVARGSRSRVEAVVLGLASLAAPVVVSLIQNRPRSPSHLDSGHRLPVGDRLGACASGTARVGAGCNATRARSSDPLVAAAPDRP
jgi:hypothetical protein